MCIFDFGFNHPIMWYQVICLYACSYLDSVFCVGGFVDASFTDREGAHADVFLQYVAVAEQQVLPM